MSYEKKSQNFYHDKKKKYSYIKDLKMKQNAI